ncbi:MAG: hypothetical protein ACC662_07355 [Planctomycetota bacterium]
MTPPPPEPAPAEPTPRTDEHPREEREKSLARIKQWSEERNDASARVIRIELGLKGVKGHEEDVANAQKFLGDVKGWLDEEKPSYERARREVEEKGLGIRLDDRIKVNTLHFKAYRRLGLIEEMLIAVLPDLKD